MLSRIERRMIMKKVIAILCMLLMVFALAA